MRRGRPPTVDYDAIRDYRKDRLAEISVIDHEIERLQDLRRELKAQASIKAIARVFELSPRRTESILNHRSY